MKHSLQRFHAIFTMCDFMLNELLIPENSPRPLSQFVTRVAIVILANTERYKVKTTIYRFEPITTKKFRESRKSAEYLLQSIFIIASYETLR